MGLKIGTKWVGRFWFWTCKTNTMPRKAVAKGLKEEEGDDKDDEEDSNDEYEESDPSIWVSIAEMQVGTANIISQSDC